MMRNLFLFAFCLCFLAFSAQAGTLVSLRDKTEINRESIHLSDVFDGIPAAKDEEIALAPEPGRQVTYPVQILTQLADNHDLIWKPKSALDNCTLVRASTDITAQMIAEEVKKKINESLGDHADSMEIVFDARDVVFHLPKGSRPDFSLKAFTFNAQTKRFQTEFVTYAQDVPVRKNLTGRALIRREIPTLARRLDAGEMVGKSDLVWLSLEEDHLPEDVLKEERDIVGMELRVNGAEGALIRARDLVPPRLVLRGGLVTLKIETPLMQITAKGRSLQDGAKGEVVRVTNLQSKRVVEGVVESSGTVRVLTIKKMASVQ